MGLGKQEVIAYFEPLVWLGRFGAGHEAEEVLVRLRWIEAGHEAG